MPASTDGRHGSYTIRISVSSWLIHKTRFVRKPTPISSHGASFTHKIAGKLVQTLPLGGPHGHRMPTLLTRSQAESRGLAPEPKKGSICRDFNNGKDKGCRWGTNCYRRHLCSDCRGAHPRFKCPTKKTETPSTPGRDARPSQQ